MEPDLVDILIRLGRETRFFRTIYPEVHNETSSEQMRHVSNGTLKALRVLFSEMNSDDRQAAFERIEAEITRLHTDISAMRQLRAHLEKIETGATEGAPASSPSEGSSRRAGPPA